LFLLLQLLEPVRGLLPLLLVLVLVLVLLDGRRPASAAAASCGRRAVAGGGASTAKPSSSSAAAAATKHALLTSAPATTNAQSSGASLDGSPRGSLKPHATRRTSAGKRGKNARLRSSHALPLPRLLPP